MATVRILRNIFDFSATNHSREHCTSTGKPELIFPTSINMRGSLIKVFSKADILDLHKCRLVLFSSQIHLHTWRSGIKQLLFFFYIKCSFHRPNQTKSGFMKHLFPLVNVKRNASTLIFLQLQRQLWQHLQIMCRLESGGKLCGGRVWFPSTDMHPKKSIAWNHSQTGQHGIPGTLH